MPDLPDDDDDDDEVDEDDEEVIKPTRRRAAPASKPAPRAAARKPVAAPSAKQNQLNFAPSQRSRQGTGVLDSQASNHMFHRNIVTIPSDDEDIDDEEDDFRPMPSQRPGRRR